MSRQPDYEVKVGKRVERGEKSYSSRVGVGFTNSANGINIILDTGIALVGGEGVQITLWPWQPREERRSSGGSGGSASDFSDDTPF